MTTVNHTQRARTIPAYVLTAHVSLTCPKGISTMQEHPQQPEQNRTEFVAYIAQWVQSRIRDGFQITNVIMTNTLA